MKMAENAHWIEKTSGIPVEKGFRKGEFHMKKEYQNPLVSVCSVESFDILTLSTIASHGGIVAPWDQSIFT